MTFESDVSTCCQPGYRRKPQSTDQPHLQGHYIQIIFKAKSETFVVNYQRAAILIVLLLRDPHGLESGQ